MAVPKGIKIIDGYVMECHPLGSGAKVHRTLEVAGLFGSDFQDRITRGVPIEDTLKDMDDAGIEKGFMEVINQHQDDPELDTGVQVIKKYPDRFLPLLSDYSINPADGMAAVRRLERFVKDYGVKGVEMMPGRIRYPPNDKRYYPIYSKCIELDVPVMLNVGIPGPPDPAWLQDPIHIDEVCWFFPELKVVMMHGGEPWQFMCVKLMLKWPNLYYMTSAFVPKHYPEEIIYYMNTRGADKIIFATAYPLVSIRRARAELEQLPLKDHVWPKFLRENAMKVFKV